MTAFRFTAPFSPETITSICKLQTKSPEPWKYLFSKQFDTAHRLCVLTSPVLAKNDQVPISTSALIMLLDLFNNGLWSSTKKNAVVNQTLDPTVALALALAS